MNSADPNPISGGVLAGRAGLALLALVAALIATSCLERRDPPRDDSDATRCATCHGDPSRPGDAIRRAAPPRDLSGGARAPYPGVGAHSIHLDAAATHGAIACDECHVVPKRADSPGHSDHPGPARIVFGTLAKQGPRSPRYDTVGRTCDNTYCHRGADAVWTEPKTSDAACGSCHGLPPPAPHPQSDRCSSCHGAVIDADRRFLAPELHVNGKVEQGPAPCTDCHGSGADPSPPRDAHGNTATTAIGVGAHRAHLAGGQASRALACTECHTVPTVEEGSRHEKGLPAEVLLTGVAATRSRAPAWDHASATCASTWCHGPGSMPSAPSPRWTSGEPLSCTGCHGAPPRAPHPQSDRCSSCHGAVVDAAGRVTARDLHVNGTVEISSGRCTDCHGSGSDPAPPSDTRGNTSPTGIGVGAHSVHLSGGQGGRPLACAECHAVPTEAQIPSHADGLPARVTITGAATARGHAPAWDHATATCSSTWCHGPDPGSPPAAPTWTTPGSLGCTSCHGAPPSAPHPQMTNCSLCHGAVVAADSRTILDRTRHVDGQVDVALPTNCKSSCHGGATDAAPLPGTPGAGAHRTHLDGTPRSRAVPCAECHLVPTTVLAVGHLDTPRPAEARFSGVATAYGASPSYAGGTCNGTACHGAAFPDGNASGGSNTAPTWARVDGSEAACGTCHGLPPPGPHPLGSLNPTCNACHKNIAADNATFLRPELHVDGKVTFELPP